MVFIPLLFFKMSSEDQSLAQFCPNCEAILPLPDVENVIICKVCKHSTDSCVYDGMETYTEKIFNVYDPKHKIQSKDEENTEADGPLVDRKCSRCGHEGMSYATLQLRSADEGQTVFFTCRQCKFKEIENS